MGSVGYHMGWVGYIMDSGWHRYRAGRARCWGEVFQGLGRVYHGLGGVAHAFGWMYHWLGLISRGLSWICNGPVISQALISWAGSHPAAKVKR